MYKKLSILLSAALIAAIGAIVAAYVFTRKPAYLLDDEDALFV